MPYFFLLLIILFPIVEWTFSIWLGNYLGGWSIIWLILGIFLGWKMLRHRNLGFILTLLSMLNQKRSHSLYTMLYPIRYLLAGLLFFFPGFLSDLLAILLILPLGTRVTTLPEAHHAQSPFSNPHTTHSTHTPTSPHIIEGEFTRVEDDPKNRS